MEVHVVDRMFAFISMHKTYEYLCIYIMLRLLISDVSLIRSAAIFSNRCGLCMGGGLLGASSRIGRTVELQKVLLP